MADLIVPSSLTTPLDAVNVLIRSLGEAPVNSIDPPPHMDAQDALAELASVDLEVQSRGWAWNREEDWQLSLDGDNKVPLPDMTLHMSRGKTETQYTRIVKRGGFVYNRELRTYQFSRAPKVDLIIRMPWDDIPQAARRYITLEACQRFHAQKGPERVVLEVNAADLRRALTTLEQQEDLDEGLNTVYSTAVQSALSGNGGLVRSRRGLL